MVGIGMLLSNYLPLKIVDKFVSVLAKLSYSDLSSYGIHRPVEGPFLFKALTGKTPVIDRGTIKKIRSKKIQVNIVTYIISLIKGYILNRISS